MAPHTPETQALTTQPGITNAWSNAPQHPNRSPHHQPDHPDRTEQHSPSPGKNPIGGFRLSQTHLRITAGVLNTDDINVAESNKQLTHARNISRSRGSPICLAQHLQTGRAPVPRTRTLTPTKPAHFR